MVNKRDVIESFICKADGAGAFMWKDDDDVFHDPERMETRHIFFTLRMIWNHSALKKCGLNHIKSMFLVIIIQSRI
jgi:hypothetical protein